MGKLKLKLKKNSDKILLGTGLVGLTVGIVMACKATTKLPEIKEDYESKMSEIEGNKNEQLEQNNLEDKEAKEIAAQDIIRRSKAEEKKQIVKTGILYVKNYTPAGLLIVGSVVCIVGSHRILAKRCAALSAAYTTVDTAFKEYRKNVIDKYGEDVDTELKDGLKAEKLKEGQTVKKFKAVNPDINAPSCYAQYFDESNPYWEGNEEYQESFFKARDNMLSQRLRSKGFVCLNEVYELFGFQPSKAGQIVGWVYKNDGQRDNEIIISRKKIYQKDRQNPIYLLDFNVDGNVLDLIDSI